MSDRKAETVMGGCFALWFVLCGLASLAVVGVLVWAVIALVNHFTA